MVNAGALEGRPGRAGTGHQPIAVAQHHLAVGADVQEEHRQPIAVGLHYTAQPGSQHPRRDVRAHVAGDARQTVHGGLRVEVDAQLAGARRRILVRGRHVRRQTDAGRRQRQEQVLHGRVAGHHHFDDLLRLDLAEFADLGDQAVDRV